MPDPFVVGYVAEDGRIHARYANDDDGDSVWEILEELLGDRTFEDIKEWVEHTSDQYPTFISSPSVLHPLIGEFVMVPQRGRHVVSESIHQDVLLIEPLDEDVKELRAEASSHPQDQEKQEALDDAIEECRIQGMGENLQAIFVPITTAKDS